jgi:hypothetical protein
MITLLLHLFRLLPFLFGGHRQLALENLVPRPANPAGTSVDTQNRPVVDT